MVYLTSQSATGFTSYLFKLLNCAGWEEQDFCDGECQVSPALLWITF